MNFNSLSNELGINAKQPVAEQLALLQQWFQKTVSRDLEFSGDEQEQWNECMEVTEAYLEHILPETKHDWIKPNPKFGGESLLSALASMGFDQVILSIKPSAIQLDTLNVNGLSPLHLAAVGGHLNTTQVLLDLGANPYILNAHQQYPLFSALMVPMHHDNNLIRNKVAIFNLLRADKIKPLKQQDDSGNTMLHQMAIHDFGCLIEEILKIDVTLAYIQNNLTHYPIHSAILNNQMQNVHFLLEIPDGALLPDKNRWLALHYAARYATDAIITMCCQASPNKKRPRQPPFF